MYLIRHDAEKQLKQIKDYPVTLVKASGGYGKTTLVTNYFSANKTPHLWLSIPSDEQSFQSIWLSILYQIEKQNVALYKELENIAPPIDALLRQQVLHIIENHMYGSENILVIDDYHYVKSKAFDQLIEQLIRLHIEGFHLLLISRTKPNLHIDELEIKRLCNKITEENLKLNTFEIVEYFKSFSLNINESTAMKIESITEGWISAIYLLIQEKLHSGQLNLDYSMENLVKDFFMDVHTDLEIDILMKTSLLEEFSLEQVLLINKDIDDVFMELLLKKNGFIYYNYRSKMYTIHNLVKVHLSDRFLRHFSKDEKLKTYKIFGDWYDEQSDFIRALQFLMYAEDYIKVISWFDSSRTQFVDNNPHVIVEIFEAIPLDIKVQHPYSYLIYISFYSTNIDMIKGAKMLSVLEGYLEKTEMSKQMKGELTLAKSYGLFNDAFGMHEKHKMAYEMLDGPSRIATKDKIASCGSPHLLFLYFKESGKLSGLVDFITLNYKYYEKLTDGCGTGFEKIVLSEYYLLSCQYENAITVAENGICLGRYNHQEDIIISGKFVIGRSYIALGDYEKAQNVLEELKTGRETCHRPIISSSYDLIISYLAILLDKSWDISKWIIEDDVEYSNILYQGFGFNYIVLGKALLQSKDYYKILSKSEDMKRSFTLYSNIYGLLHYYLMLSIAEANIFGIDKGYTTFRKALSIAEKDRIVHPFLEYGYDVIVLLKQHMKHSSANVFVSEVLMQCEIYMSYKQENTDQVCELMKLTSREVEVIGLLSNGLKNKEISDALCVAEVTVKKHLSSIYSKLNVSCRTKAVKVWLKEQ